MSLEPVEAAATREATIAVAAKRLRRVEAPPQLVLGRGLTLDHP